jgi:hypothetical protein
MFLTLTYSSLRKSTSINVLRRPCATDYVQDISGLIYSSEKNIGFPLANRPLYMPCGRKIMVIITHIKVINKL